MSKRPRGPRILWREYATGAWMRKAGRASAMLRQQTETRTMKWTRRDMLRLGGAAPLAAWTWQERKEPADAPPALAPGAPASAERKALIDAFQRQAEGLDDRFEKRTHNGAWTMPYRLYKPSG